MAIIDLRGSPTGLAELGEGLAALIEALKHDPDDEFRQMLIDNPDLGRHLARTSEQHGRDIQSGKTPVDPRVGDASVVNIPLPTPPGMGMFSPTILAEARAMFPETELEIATRERGVAEAKLATTQATRQSEIIQFATEAGLSTEAIGRLEMVRFDLEKAGVNLDKAGIERFGAIYDNSNEADKKLIDVSLTGPRAAGFMQALLQRERFDNERALASLRASIVDADTVEELREARFIFKKRITDARDDVIDRIHAIEGGEGDKNTLPALVDDLKDYAETMLLVDPARAVQTAGLIQGIIFRNKIKGVDFSMTDIVPDASDQIELAAQMMLSADDPIAARAFLEDANKDRLTGIVNERMMNAILTRVDELKLSESEDEMLQRAAEAANSIAGNERELNKNRQRIIDLEAELAEYLENKDDPNQPAGARKRGAELPLIIRFHKLMSFFAGPERERTGGHLLSGIGSN